MTLALPNWRSETCWARRAVGDDGLEFDSDSVELCPNCARGEPILTNFGQRHTRCA
jgi:hypothetical protein